MKFIPDKTIPGWLVALLIMMLLNGCGSRHFIEINRKITNDLEFAGTKVVVIDVSADYTPFTEREVTISSSRTIRSGVLKPDIRVIANALSESLSFDGKSVLTREEYNRIQSQLVYIRPRGGFRSPRIDALVRIKVTYGIQSGRYEQEKVFGFFRRTTRCLYLKNPPKNYEPCREVENRAWDEIRSEHNALGKVDLWYSGEIYLNRNDEFRLHRSFNGAVVLNTTYEDERAIHQKVAAGLGAVLSNELGIVELKVRLQIDEGNHSGSVSLLKGGRVEEARKLLEKDVQSNWIESSTDYYNLGLIYHSYGELKMAADYYSRAVSSGGYKRMYIDALKNLKVLDAETTLD